MSAPANDRRCSPYPPQRQGTVLILVASLASLLMILATTFLVKLRTQGDEAALVIQDTQARVMLGAAMMYIQEASRLGWSSDPGGEAFGWTDVRYGATGGTVGPRAPGQGARGTGGSFPNLGTAMRADMHTWQRPPYAIQAKVYAPAQIADEHLAEPFVRDILAGPPTLTIKRRWSSRSGFTHNGHLGGYIWDRALYPEVDGAATTAADAINSPLRFRRRSLAPLAAADTFGDFQSGNKIPVPESMGLGWFRIYRETEDDHNGDGNPWYDTSAIAGHSVFIVTVGAGGSRGFRFWDSSTDFLNGEERSVTFSRDLEPTTASESGLFPPGPAGKLAFQRIRSSERILWFRLEWSPSIAAGADLRETLSLKDLDAAAGLPNQFHGLVTNSERQTDANYPTSQGGTILWIQRLHQEPPKW